MIFFSICQNISVFRQQIFEIFEKVEFLHDL